MSKGVERSLNSSNCYSCRKGQKITLCTQYRYIQCYVKRVERLCYVETRDIHIFANFLNIQAIFNPKKVFGKLRLRPFQCNVCRSMLKGLKVEITFDAFNIHGIDGMVGKV